VFVQDVSRCDPTSPSTRPALESRKLVEAGPFEHAFPQLLASPPATDADPMRVGSCAISRERAHLITRLFRTLGHQSDLPLHHFGPSLRVRAWTPPSSGKTAVRGGYVYVLHSPRRQRHAAVLTGPLLAIRQLLYPSNSAATFQNPSHPVPAPFPFPLRTANIELGAAHHRRQTTTADDAAIQPRCSAERRLRCLRSCDFEPAAHGCSKAATSTKPLLSSEGVPPSPALLPTRWVRHGAGSLHRSFSPGGLDPHRSSGFSMYQACR